MATKKSKLKKTKATATVKPSVGTTAQPTDVKKIGADDPSSLSIGDLKNLSTILDVASSRGAFRANEMASVGLIYNKLQAFLAKVAPPEPKKEGAPATAAPATAAPATMAPTTAAPATTPITPETGIGKI